MCSILSDFRSRRNRPMESRVSKPEHRNQRLKVLHIHAKASIKLLEHHNENVPCSERITGWNKLTISSRTNAFTPQHPQQISRLVALYFARSYKPKATQKQLKQQLDSPQVNDFNTIISDDQKHSTKRTRTHVTTSFHLKVTVLESLKKCYHVHDLFTISLAK